jgi:hypothetical protein
MSHFAKVENGIVTQVIVAEQDFINSGAVGDPSTWVQTSYNTQSGVHLGGGQPFRKNYAGIGYSYDPVRDAFIPPKLFNSWILQEDTCMWMPPFPRPEDDKYYVWDEETVSWLETVSILPVGDM